MPSSIPTVSLLDSLLYNLCQVLPSYLQGLFTRSRFWMSFWSAIHPDPLGVKLVRRFRRKYDSDYLYLYMLRTKSLVVLDPEGIRRVLDYSPTVYAEASLKRRGMSHFQPNAVTISRGAAWHDRRAFNEGVVGVAAGQVHPMAGPFLDVVRLEVARLQQRAGDRLGWPDLADLFERVTLQVAFGKGGHDTTVTTALHAMMREANRVALLRKSRHFDGFYASLRNYLRYPPAASLVALCPHAPATDVTRVENQIPHWLFAMKDTLAENVARALALILAHPFAEHKVREELAQADLGTVRGIDGLAYLEGCLQEAMRLWPTTPLLVREMVMADVLGGTVVPHGTQVLILNGFNHRDADTLSSADTFVPDRWQSSPIDYRFNHLSNGPQVCAGKDLALFIGKAVLATLLAGGRYALIRPALDPDRPLPHAYNYYRLALSRTPRA